MYQIKIVNSADGATEEIKDINDITFMGEVMIICLADLKTRLVRPLSKMTEYIYKEQPYINANKQSKRTK